MIRSTVRWLREIWPPFILALFAAIWLSTNVCPADPVPSDVAQLWADFDPRRDPLEVEVVKSWRANGGRYQIVRYTIGTFRGEKSTMAAYYGYPLGGTNLPGLMHMHGGGQKAFLREVEYYVERGFACLSVNWGGRPIDEENPDGPNTHWGAVDPTQNNVRGYFSMSPSDRTVEKFPSPKNNNWYLLTLGCRRGLTFLESRPEVDAERLGVYGHSMGGSLTMYVAGCDDRVRAASPSVGGSGFLTSRVNGIAGTQRRVEGDVELFRRTLEHQSYARRIACPLLFLGATNDFNGLMDNAYRTIGLIPEQPTRLVFAPHLNHRFALEQEICRPLWFDAQLRNRFVFPEAPQLTLELDADDGLPGARVTVDDSRAVSQVDVYYAVDPDPRARFWRDAQAHRHGDVWRAACPLLDLSRPLYAFANVYYALDEPETAIRNRAVGRFCLSSNLAAASPDVLRRAGVVATDQTSLEIDDFSRGFHDWYILEAGNPHHWQFWTRKPTDPKWHGPADTALSLDVKSMDANTLVVTLVQNEWRRYRGRRRTFHAEASLEGSDDWRTVRLTRDDFVPEDEGPPLDAWNEIDQLGLRAFVEVTRDGRTHLLGTRPWAGPQPEFRRLEWVR